METWTNYFSSTASVAATLTGLIFVGLSVNVKKILVITKDHLPSRALGSLVLLTNIVVVSNLCLIPGQPILFLGIELLIVSLIIWVAVTRVDLIMYRSVEIRYKGSYFRSLIYSQLSILPFLSAGVLFACHSRGGFYLLVPGVVFSLIKSMVDVWYLTVVINK